MRCIFRRIPVFLLLGIFCVSAAWAAQYPKPYPSLIADAKEIERYETIMPLRIVHMATRFAEAPDPELTARLVKDMLVTSPNRFVRRIGFTTLRLMGKKSFRSMNPGPVVMEGLDDRDPWVRHDAVLAGEALCLDSPDLRLKLAQLAQGMDPSEYDAVDPYNAEGQLKKRAGLLLRKLSSSNETPRQ